MDKGTLFEGSILHIPATRFARSCLMEFFFLTCAEILRARLACHILTKSEHHTSSKNTLWEKLGCNKEATRVYLDSLIIHCYHNFKAKTIFSVCFIRQDNRYNIVSKYNERTSSATRICLLYFCTVVPTQHLINLHIFPYIFRHQDLPCHASEEFADNFQAIMAMFLGDRVGSNRGNNNASTRLLCSWRNNNRSSKIYVSTSGPKAARRHQKGPIYSCKNKTITRLEICDTESFFLC